MGSRASRLAQVRHETDVIGTPATMTILKHEVEVHVYMYVHMYMYVQYTHKIHVYVIKRT